MPAITVNGTFLHAQSYLKVPSTYASGEELRMANFVQSIISAYYRWSWTVTVGTDIAISSGTQEYNLAAGNQNMVMAIHQANLLEGTTEQPDLLIWNDPVVPRTSTTGQPYAVSMILPTRIRLFPTPDATYTFQWRYHARPVIFTANTESFQIPEAYTDVAKAGMVWQLLSYADDDRAPVWEKTFDALLKNHVRVEQITSGRNKV